MQRKKLIFTGGHILTMAENKTAEAILVEDSKITFVGGFQKCKKQAISNYEIINLEGKTLIPGFVDCHTHPFMFGMCKIWADVSYPKVQCIEDLISVLKEHSRNLPAAAPIRGFGFDQRRLKELRYPTAQDLDRVAIDRPVQIMHVSGHCNVCNTFLLRSIGVTDDAEDSVGGSFGRDENGKPNGPLWDSANDLLAGESGVKPGNHGPNIHMPDSLENLMKQLKVAQENFLGVGITTVNEIQLTKQELNAYLAARDSGILKLRVEMSFLSNYLDEVIDLGFNATFGDDKLTIGSIKFYSDASLLSGTANLSSGYIDSEKKGYYYHQNQELIDLLIKAHINGLQTCTHAQGDIAIEAVIQAVEQAQKIYPRNDMRHRIEHCGLPTEEQCKRIAKLDIYPVLQTEMNYLYGDGVLNAVGVDVAVNYSPTAWFKKYGVNFILSSDAPVTTPNPMEAVHAAVSRKTILNNVLGAHQAVSIDDALKAYTITAAKGCRREKIAGSIEEGKLADFAVLNANPYDFEDKIDEIRNIKVLETWINGEKVFER